MRVTVDLDEDILPTVQEVARQRGVSLGEAVSILLRESLARSQHADTRNGLPLFPASETARVVTAELIRRLLEGV